MIIVLGGDWVRNVMKWMKLNNELSMWCHILRHRMANAQCSYHMILIVSLSYILVSFICILACWLIPKESDMKKEKNNLTKQNICLQLRHDTCLYTVHSGSMSKKLIVWHQIRLGCWIPTAAAQPFPIWHRTGGNNPIS